MTALPTFATEANALQVDVNTQQTSAATSATNAATSATNSAASATASSNSAANSLASANAAAATAGAAEWVSGNTYILGANVFSPSNFQTYRKITASSVSTIDPVTDTTNWTRLGGIVPVTVIRSARTSNTILGTSDIGTLIDITSGTFTQTFTAAATLATGWWCYIKNSGAGDITLDPNSSELIDGLTSYVMYPGEVRLVQCTGTAFTTIVLQSFVRTVTSTMTFVKPPGYTVFEGDAWSGGNSGQRTGSASNSSGGAGGGCAPFTIPTSITSSSFTITIGAGGLAVTTAANGNLGGNTSIGTYFTVYAGTSDWRNGGSVVSGLSTSAVSVGFEGAVPVGSTTNASTVYGGAAPVTTAGAANGSSVYGGASGGSIVSNTLGAAGTSVLGGNGGAASLASNGTAGAQPAGGGGATQTGTQSGAGGAGQVIITGR